MRTHLQRLYVNTGVPDERLQAFECPPACAHLWSVFMQLGRAAGGAGLSPLTQSELQAWQANYGTRLTGWEIDTLFAMDNVAAQVRAQHQNTPG